MENLPVISGLPVLFVIQQIFGDTKDQIMNPDPQCLLLSLQISSPVPCWDSLMTPNANEIPLLNLTIEMASLISL